MDTTEPDARTRLMRSVGNSAKKDIKEAIGMAEGNKKVLKFACEISESFAKQANDFAMQHTDLATTRSLAYFPVRWSDSMECEELVALIPNELFSPDAPPLSPEDAMRQFPHTILRWPERS